MNLNLEYFDSLIKKRERLNKNYKELINKKYIDKNYLSNCAENILKINKNLLDLVKIEIKNDLFINEFEHKFILNKSKLNEINKYVKIPNKNIILNALRIVAHDYLKVLSLNNLNASTNKELIHDFDNLTKIKKQALNLNDLVIRFYDYTYSHPQTLNNDYYVHSLILFNYSKIVFFYSRKNMTLKNVKNSLKHLDQAVRFAILIGVNHQYLTELINYAEAFHLKAQLRPYEKKLISKLDKIKQQMKLRSYESNLFNNNID